MKIKNRLPIATISLLLLSLSLSLSACTPAVKVREETMMEAHVKTITPERRAAIMARIEKEARGISTGSGAPNKAFVFFDPHCSYCSDLWRATQSVENQVDFVWVPVSVFGEESAAMGAVILDSENPAGIMSANEESMRLSENPLAITSVPTEAALSTVESNTALMFALDPAAPIQSVPLMYYRSAKGQIEVIPGALEAGALKSSLKLE